MKFPKISDFQDSRGKEKRAEGGGEDRELE